MAKLLKNASLSRLRGVVPKWCYGQLPTRIAEHYTVVVFKPGRNSVIPSNPVRALLDEIPEGGNPIIAVGGNFTIEARKLLRNRKALVVYQSDFEWTDDSYRQIKERC